MAKNMRRIRMGSLSRKAIPKYIPTTPLQLGVRATQFAKTVVPKAKVRFSSDQHTTPLSSKTYGAYKDKVIQQDNGNFTIWVNPMRMFDKDENPNAEAFSRFMYFGNHSYLGNSKNNVKVERLGYLNIIGSVLHGAAHVQYSPHLDEINDGDTERDELFFNGISELEDYYVTHQSIYNDFSGAAVHFAAAHYYDSNPDKEIEDSIQADIELKNSIDGYKQGTVSQNDVIQNLATFMESTTSILATVEHTGNLAAKQAALINGEVADEKYGVYDLQEELIDKLNFKDVVEKARDYLPIISSRSMRYGKRVPYYEKYIDIFRQILVDNDIIEVQERPNTPINDDGDERNDESNEEGSSGEWPEEDDLSGHDTRYVIKDYIVDNGDTPVMCTHVSHDGHDKLAHGDDYADARNKNDSIIKSLNEMMDAVEEDENLMQDVMAGITLPDDNDWVGPDIDQHVMDEAKYLFRQSSTIRLRITHNELEGSISQRKVWKVAAGIPSQRVFKQRPQRQQKAAAVLLLVDGSGSMASVYQYVYKFASSVHQALIHDDNIHIYMAVYGSQNEGCEYAYPFKGEWRYPKFHGGGTPLWSALGRAFKFLDDRFDDKISKTIVHFTDGGAGDNPSEMNGVSSDTHIQHLLMLTDAGKLYGTEHIPNNKEAHADMSNFNQVIDVIKKELYKVNTR